MPETLGMLCDKLTIVKLKQYHTEDEEKLLSLNKQAVQLKEEIDNFISDAINGIIPLERITFASNKVYKKEGNEVSSLNGSIGELFFKLADINCHLWHEVEKGYNIENVPVEEKNVIVKKLAVLNLERNNCIDAIDNQFLNIIKSKNIN